VIEPLARLLERGLATIADVDIAGGSARLDVCFDFHRVFPFLEKFDVDCSAWFGLRGADDDIAIRGPGLHIRFYFHGCISFL